MAASALPATPSWLSNSTDGEATYALRSNATIARSCGAGPVESASHAASATIASRLIPLIQVDSGNSLYGGTWDHSSKGGGRMSDAAMLGIRSMDLGRTWPGRRACAGCASRADDRPLRRGCSREAALAHVGDGRTGRMGTLSTRGRSRTERCIPLIDPALTRCDRRRRGAVRQRTYRARRDDVVGAARGVRDVRARARRLPMEPADDKPVPNASQAWHRKMVDGGETTADDLLRRVRAPPRQDLHAERNVVMAPPAMARVFMPFSRWVRGVASTPQRYGSFARPAAPIRVQVSLQQP